MTKRIAASIAVVVLATAVSVTVATPAQAVTGLQYVTAASAFDSVSPKSLTVFCPAGTVAIGGGAHITGATGDATIRRLSPASLFGLNYLGVTAEEDPDGFAGSWLVQAVAVCVPPPAGFAYVSTSGSDPALLWVTSSCGAKRIIGSGYSVTTTAAVKATGYAFPSSNRSYLSVEPSRVPGAVVPYTGTSVAVCANAALPGLQVVEVETAHNSVDGKSAVAVCPAGTQVVGVGGDLWRFRNHTVMDDIMINTASNSVVVTGYEDQFGNPDVWAATAYAFCAN